MSEAMAFSCKDLCKTYAHASGDVTVLDHASLAVKQGELVALVGPSGSGKSTFLHLAGLLDEASAGELQLLGKPVQQLNEQQQTLFRRDYLGFVYQKHHLLPELSVIENVMMPLRLQATMPLADMRDKAAVILDEMGLSHRLQHQPPELSGGEAQRVAIARAMIHQPKLVLADEPTGNLDEDNTKLVMQHFIDRCRLVNASAIVVTHNLQMAHQLNRVVQITAGKISEKAA